jgi:hypothetical protein
MADLAINASVPGMRRAVNGDVPNDACQFFYECPACKAVICPKPGDCCVYCSYGDQPCPSVQDGVPCPDGHAPRVHRGG